MSSTLVPPPKSPAPPTAVPIERRILAGLLGAGLAVLTALAFGPRSQPATTEDLARAALADPAVREAAVAMLVDAGGGVWDAHVDADVGRVLLPEIEDRRGNGSRVSSNRFGMRERDYELVKPAGTVRVILLGDSYVYGYGIEADERIGSFLEPMLRAAAPDGREVEVLHLAIPSWNIVAESAFLRRQLSDLRPDLVVHVVVSNDLDDSFGVRGFGAAASFTPRHRARNNGMVMKGTRRGPWEHRAGTPLLFDLDAESRERYDEAAAELERLSAAVEESGARYVLVARWTRMLPKVARLAAGLQPDQLVYVGDDFSNDPDTWVDEVNRHWNAAASERLAHLLYGLAAERDWLPEFDLAPTDRSREEKAAIHDAGLRDAAKTPDWALAASRLSVGSSMDFDLDVRAAAPHVYAGLDRHGCAAPYVSVVLASEGARFLRLRVQRLQRPELFGGVARVSVEGHAVGSFELTGDRDLELTFELGADVAARDFANVRIESDDYAYGNHQGAECRAFVLREASFLSDRTLDG